MTTNISSSTTEIQMRAMFTKQALQEKKYVFPRHHIPTWGCFGFSHFRVMPPAYEYASYCRFVVSRLEAMRFDSILDLGCGDGRLALELQARFPEATVTGVDIAARAIVFAKAFAPDCQFVCGDIRDPSVAASQFDVVTMIEVLEHIDPNETTAFLRAVWERVKDDGHLILTVPSLIVPVPRQHFRHFDEKTLRATVEPLFGIEEITFLNRKAWWTWVLYRLMCNRLFVLANRRLLTQLLRLYERRLLLANPSSGTRLFAVCRKSPGTHGEGTATGAKSGLS